MADIRFPVEMQVVRNLGDEDKLLIGDRSDSNQSKAINYADLKTIITSGVGGAESLNDLNDVDTITNPPSGNQSLVWDENTQLWVPGDTAGAGDISTGLEKITINGQSGWRLIGKDPTNYTGIGHDAVDISEGCGCTESGCATGATGCLSFASGWATRSIGDMSHAEGVLTKSNGTASHAEGCNAKSIGEGSHAEGLNTEAGCGCEDDPGFYGDYSHAEGRETNTNGDYSHAEGVGTVTWKDGSHAEGLNTEAGCGCTGSTNHYGNYSHAEGINTVTNGDYAHAEGINTYAGKFDYIDFESGNPTELSNGTGSHAEGYDTKSYGTYSHAEGYGTNAGGCGYANNTGNASHAEGYETLSHADYAHTEGVGTKTIGKGSHAEGCGSESHGTGSHAEGYNTESGCTENDSDLGQYSHTEGYNTKTKGNYSHAEGQNTESNGIGSHAEGLSSEAIGNFSHVEGRETNTNGDYSHAEGFNTITNADYQHVQGTYNIGLSATIHETGIGFWDEGANRKNAFEIYTDGTLTAPEATVTDINNRGNSAIVTKEYVDGISGGAPSGLELVTETHSGWRLIGQDPTYYGEIGVSAVDLSISHNTSSTMGATGYNSFAEGRNTTASGGNSHAEGRSTIASGSDSHAEGQNTTASGNTSHTEGFDTTASGDNSHAEGQNTTASGNVSHAEGGDTFATAYYTHAEGYRTNANNMYQHVQGRYNVGTSTETIHETGIGTTGANRKNAFEIYTDGTLTAPESTITLINARGLKALTTTEWVNDRVSGIGTLLPGYGESGGNVVASDIDLSLGNMWSKTITADTTFTFTNTHSLTGFTLQLTDAGSFVITWPASVKWPDGTAPTLTALDIVTFMTFDAGTTWMGMVQTNFS